MATSDDLEGAILSVVGAGKMAQPTFLPDEDVSPPYVHLLPRTAKVVLATDRTWIWQVTYEVVLCTTFRDRAMERSMAAALDAANIGYEIDFGYDQDERVMMAIFTTTPVDEIETPAATDGEESED